MAVLPAKSSARKAQHTVHFVPRPLILRAQFFLVSDSSFQYIVRMFLIFRHHFYLFVKPSIKTVSQCLCLDIRFILPFADREVPSVCTWVPMCTVCAAGCPHVSVFKTIREFATLAYPETPYHPNRAYENECEESRTSGKINDADILYANAVIMGGGIVKSQDEPVNSANALPKL